MSVRLEARRSRWRQARAVVAGLLLLPGATGCYRSVPVWEGTPTPQSEITVGLSDRGRTTLAPQLGPGARHVSGRLVQVTDSAYVLKVTSIDYINPSVSGSWTGEEVSVPRDLVSGVMERRLSRGRTWIAAGIVAVGIGLATTIAIRGFGNDQGTGKPSDGGGGQQQ